MATLTKDELSEEVSQVVGVSLTQGHAILESMLDSMVRTLRGGGRVEFRGFGSFGTRLRGARVGRNPKTGARVDVPAQRICYFKPGKELRQLVNRRDG